MSRAVTGPDSAFSLEPEGSNPDPVHGIAKLGLDPILWHAGGIDTWGNLVAIPIEYPHWTNDNPGRFENRAAPPQFGDRNLSRIQIVDLSVQPRVLPVSIERNGSLATCAGFTRLMDGRFVLIVLSQPGPLVRVDCYISKTTDLLQGFDLGWQQDVQQLSNFQSLSLLTSDTGVVYAVSFAGAGKIELKVFALGDALQPPADWKPVVHLKDLKIGPGDARAGCTLTRVNGRLTLWAVARYRDPVTGRLSAVQLVPEQVPVAAPVARSRRPGSTSRSISTHAGKYKLTAVRDPFDFRDLMYSPRLIEVPTHVPLDTYLAHKVPVLDQKTTSACTGFALATVIHYLQRTRKVVRDEERVSARMIYQMAKRYDEWPGKRYQGSSCRGAMKAWHKHGVCGYDAWPDEIRQMGRQAGWTEAWRRPLGAYYRVNHKDLIAMHAAIAEVGVLYVSAETHDGWDQVDEDGVIPWIPELPQLGGHAFAIVAYDDRGFWMQNSWTEGWGRKGFALLTYDDWLANGSDAWVARLGAPITLNERRSTAQAIQTAARGTRSYVYADLRPHIITTGNNGELRTSGTYGTDERDVERMFTEDFVENTKGWKKRRLMLYAHGGLVSEDAALQRIADYVAPLREAELHMIGFVWRTDFWSTVTNVLQDGVRRRRAEGFIDDTKDFMLDRLDDGLEVIARESGGPALWREMKQSAELATRAERGGAYLVANHLVDLRKRFADLELHFIAHSAGSIYFSRMLQYLTQACSLPIDSVTLWAPAITLSLFRETYLPALREGLIRRMTLFTLDDESELDDHCSNIYHKSLLYLVSNAFEKRPRDSERAQGRPLLGLAKFVKDDPDIRDLIRRGRIEWIVAPTTGGTGIESQANAHGAFDDDLPTVHATLRRILPAGTVLPPLNFPRTASAKRDRRAVLNALR